MSMVGGPASSRPVAPVPGQEVGRPSRWSWVWAFTPLLTVGIATPAVALYAAVHRRSLGWWLAFGGYAAAVAAGFALTGYPEGSAQDEASGAVIAIVWVIGSGHALAMRRKVFTPPPLPDANDHALGEALGDRARRAEARELLATDPSLASDLGIGRPDLGRGYDDGGLVDLNSAPAHVFGPVLGLDEATAARVLAAREATAGFTSVEELVVLAELSPSLVDRVRDRIVLSPRG